jgi:hypothetical protein
MDAVEEPRRGVVAVHVEGLPRDGERAPDGIDYERAVPPRCATSVLSPSGQRGARKLMPPASSQW